MPLLVTLFASDLNNGNIGPVCLFFDIFCTVSTTIELVSCAPLSAKSAPGIDSIYFLQCQFFVRIISKFLNYVYIIASICYEEYVPVQETLYGDPTM